MADVSLTHFWSKDTSASCLRTANMQFQAHNNVAAWCISSDKISFLCLWLHLKDAEHEIRCYGRGSQLQRACFQTEKRAILQFMSNKWQDVLPRGPWADRAVGKDHQVEVSCRIPRDPVLA